MDQGLTRAVEQFVAAVRQALTSAGTEAELAERLAVQEAYNLCTAFIDVDGRHTDDELWALVERFTHLGQLRPETTPGLVRSNNLVEGRRSWLTTSSDLFETLRQVDELRGSRLTRDYYDQAMALAHTVASLDQFPSDDELKAIVAFQRLLMAAFPQPRARSAEPGPTAPGAPAAAAVAEPASAPAEEPLPPPEPLEDLLTELDALIGLAAVKQEVRLLAALTRVQKLRRDRGLKVVDTNNHLIFSGNPGTGKTTVARLLARIYRTLGVVAKGHYTETDRADLVAGFVGQTATKVAEVFARADGGVLLIDEAYSLTRGGERDFGREAIDAIVKEVEDRRETMAVILAGYPAEMTELVATNPGFESRFPKTIHFPDYTDVELVEILKLIADKGGYTLGPETLAAAEAWFGAHVRGPGFGNGRLARNLFEAAVLRHAERVAAVAEPTNEQLSALQPADIASVPTRDETRPPELPPSAPIAPAEPVSPGPVDTGPVEPAPADDEADPGAPGDPADSGS